MRVLILFTPILLSLAFNTNARPIDDTEFHQLGRFTKIKTSLPHIHSNPLMTIVSIKFPPSIKTIEQSIVYSLEQTGYSLSPLENMSDETKILMNLPLPRIHRDFQFVSMENILKTLAGDAYSLLVDPVSRQINFYTNFKY